MCQTTLADHIPIPVISNQKKGPYRSDTGKWRALADSIAKRDKKAARKAAKESLATFVTEEKEKYESEMA